MADVYKVIRQAIVDKITAEMVGSGKVVSFVYRSDKSRFEGYPALIITPSDNDADYGDSSMKEYNPVFTVRAHVPINVQEEDGEAVDDGQEGADDTMDEVIDQLLTIFANSSALGTACEWVHPATGVWGYQDREIGRVRVAEVKLRCRKYISN